MTARRWVSVPAGHQLSDFGFLSGERDWMALLGTGNPAQGFWALISRLGHDSECAGAGEGKENISGGFQQAHLCLALVISVT